MRDRVLQFASVSFDTSAEEIYPCLASGGTLVLRTEGMIDTAEGFLSQCEQDDSAECALPNAVQSVLETGMAPVRVVPSPDEWLGITWADDRAIVQARIRRLVEARIYPSPLRPR